MIYNAKLEWKSDGIEEEVLLLINDVEIICFANVMPYEVKEGNYYRVDMIPNFFGGYDIKEVGRECLDCIARDPNKFSYKVTGWLLDNKIYSNGIVFEDEEFMFLFGYLNGRKVTLNIDRIDVEFLV